MKRKKNFLLYFSILLAILAGIFVVWQVKDRMGADAYGEGRVPVSEVSVMLSFGSYEQEEWDQWLGTYHKEYLNGDILRDILEKLQLGSYIEVSEGMEHRSVSREEWGVVYEQILDYLDMDHEVQKQTLLVLDCMEAEKGNVMITNAGDFFTELPLSYFVTWNAYEAYTIEDKWIGIRGINEEEQKIENAYLLECSEDSISFLYGGSAYQIETGNETIELASGVCDFVFAAGKLSTIRTKQDVITGELLSYDDNIIEIKGYGRIQHSGKLPVYQTYGEVVEKSISDIILGNMQVEYVTGDQQVCAILIRQPADIQDIRVLLLAEDGSNYRGEVYLKTSSSAVLHIGEREETLSPDTIINAADYMPEGGADTLTLSPETAEGQITICNDKGEEKSNGYYGSMEVRRLAEGYTLINQVPFETYLCAVVPSEMPSNYEAEALRAQAVCARSYAYIQLLQADLAEFGAHISDSTSYQVYNKVAPTEATTAAVYDTAGKVLTYQGSTIEAYYFSTSMGYTDTAEVWNVEDLDSCGYLKSVCLNTAAYGGDLSDEAEFLSYISSPGEGYDSDIKFYRWTASADYRDKTDEINAILVSRRGSAARNVQIFEADENTPVEEESSVGTAYMKKLGEITGMSVKERSGAGSILTLKITYEKGYVLVKTEYNIRKVLGAGVEKMVYADASESADVTMLPSAFCSLGKNADGTMTLYGGGFGHGLGMSQNGANGMAKAGMNYEEILHYFYNDINISEIN